MLVDWSDVTFLLASQSIPDNPRSGRRTSIVIVSPRHIYRTFHQTGKVDHIVIGQGLNSLPVELHLLVEAVEVWVSSSSARLGIASHIAESRMSNGYRCNPRVKSCQYD